SMIALVMSMSAREGVGSPEGWLCTNLRRDLSRRFLLSFSHRYEMPVRDHPGMSRWIRLSNFQARRITVPCPLHPDSGTKADIAGGRRSAKPRSRHDATSGFKLVERSVLLV